jgi:hypothetical protein
MEYRHNPADRLHATTQNNFSGTGTLCNVNHEGNITMLIAAT